MKSTNTSSNIIEKVNEMKNTCCTSNAMVGDVLEILGVKFDQMHHNLKSKIDDIDLSVGNIDSDVIDINTRMERVEGRMEEMAVELGAMHQKFDGIADKVDQIYKFLSR